MGHHHRRRNPGQNLICRIRSHRMCIIFLRLKREGKRTKLFSSNKILILFPSIGLPLFLSDFFFHSLTYGNYFLSFFSPFSSLSVYHSFSFFLPFSLSLSLSLSLS